MTTAFKPKTANWQPPTDLPQNWRLLRKSEDGAAYKNRTGLMVISPAV